MDMSVNCEPESREQMWSENQRGSNKLRCSVRRRKVRWPGAGGTTEFVIRGQARKQAKSVLQ